MERDIFGAGTAPGSPVKRSEVGILICHLLTYADGPLSFDILHAALREHELVNYFVLVEELERLQTSGQIGVAAPDNGAQNWFVTQTGREIARELAKTLPASVRRKAEDGLHRVQKRDRRISEVSVREIKKSVGWMLELSIPDQESDLISIQVFAPTPEQRDEIRRRFLNDPIYIYGQILALLTGNRHVIGDMGPDPNPVF